PIHRSSRLGIQTTTNVISQATIPRLRRTTTTTQLHPVPAPDVLSLGALAVATNPPPQEVHSHIIHSSRGTQPVPRFINQGPERSPLSVPSGALHQHVRQGL